MLVDMLLAAKDRSPGKLAVADGRQALTYLQTARLASVLRGLVLRETQCERIGLMLPASSIFPPALFGVLWSAKTVVPLNFLLNADELSGIVEDASIDLILTLRYFADLSGRLPARAVFLDELPLKRRVLFSMLRRLPPPPKVEPRSTAVILYTSGTTAEPKGVELTHQNLHANCIDTVESLDIDSRHLFLNILPPFHVFGLTCNVLGPVAAGASVHAIPRFSPTAAVKTVEQQGISIMLAIPSMYAAILKRRSAKPDSFRSVELAISGGEPLSDAVRIGFEERFGVIIRQGYGLTETSPVVSACSADAHRDGTVGRPIRNVELRIIDPDAKVLPAGEDGEILVRGPGVMKGYYRRPEETRQVLDADGWFATGDVGHLDDQGFLTITGRKKEMLIIGGENVFPREIEAALEAHEAVAQAAVIGVPDDLRGELPVAFVIPHPGAGPTEQDLRNHTKKALAGFKVPKRVIIREDLPAGPTGKILKRRLHDLL